MKPLLTIQLAKMLPKGKLRRPRELRPVDPSHAGEVALRTILFKLLRRVVNRAAAELLPAVRFEREALGIRDAAGDKIKGAADRLKQLAAIDADQAAEEAGQELRKETQRHRRRWVATINSGVGIDISALLQDDAVADILALRSVALAGLIRSATDAAMDQIAQAALRGVFGAGTDEVAREIDAVLGVGRRKARLLARDQMAKLNSSLNEYRQREIGVTKYKWKTIIDGRERTHHHTRNNKLFSWEDPPKGGHPGSEINCRCRALAVIVLPGEEQQLEN